MGFCYLNGEIVDENQASVPVTNFGLLRGLGVFDLFRARNGKPTFMEDHLDRFEGSQKFLNLSRLIEKEEIRSAVRELQQKNQFAESTFKLVLTGQGTDSDVQFDPHFFILNTELPRDLTSPPSTLITSKCVRQFPQIKTLNYLSSYRLQQQKIEAGANDILFHQDGFISETSRSNVFVIKDGIIATPDKNILKGITRKNILKMVEDHLQVQIRPVTLKEVYEADEVFITSTIKEIMPIVKIDDQVIGRGEEGELTNRLKGQFREISR